MNGFGLSTTGLQTEHFIAKLPQKKTLDAESVEARRTPWIKRPKTDFKEVATNAPDFAVISINPQTIRRASMPAQPLPAALPT